MAKWAEENQTEFYKIYARLIPIEQHHSGELGTYTAQPIPVEERDSDRAVAGPARASANGHSA